MSEPIDLNKRRPAVHYTVTVTQHWNGAVEIYVHDVSDDQRSRDSVADALARGFAPWFRVEHVHKLALGVVDALMDAPRDHPERAYLAALVDAVRAMERHLFPLDEQQSAMLLTAERAVRNSPPDWCKADFINAWGRVTEEVGAPWDASPGRVIELIRAAVTASQKETPGA